MQLVTWNTQGLEYSDAGERAARIAQTIDALADCDVLCLQEIVNEGSAAADAQDQLSRLRQLLPQWQIFFGAAVDRWTQGHRQQWGNLIATRLSVLNVQHYPLPYPIDQSAQSTPRMATAVTVQDPALGPVRIITTHLELHSLRQRLSQAHYLRRLHFESLSQYYAPGMEAQAVAGGAATSQAPEHTLSGTTPHAVLCGDFSFDPEGVEYAAMTSEAAALDCLEAGWPEPVVGARWNDAWQLLHPGQRQHAGAQRDFVWVSDGLRTQVRDWVAGSPRPDDHRPPVRVLIGA